MCSLYFQNYTFKSSWHDTATNNSISLFCRWEIRIRYNVCYSCSLCIRFEFKFKRAATHQHVKHPVCKLNFLVQLIWCDKNRTFYFLFVHFCFIGLWRACKHFRADHWAGCPAWLEVGEKSDVSLSHLRVQCATTFWLSSCFRPLLKKERTNKNKDHKYFSLLTKVSLQKCYSLSLFNVDNSITSHWIGLLKIRSSN